jgi:hypothetical protein
MYMWRSRFARLDSFRLCSERATEGVLLGVSGICYEGG